MHHFTWQAHHFLRFRRKDSQWFRTCPPRAMTRPAFQILKIFYKNVWQECPTTCPTGRQTGFHTWSWTVFNTILAFGGGYNVWFCMILPTAHLVSFSQTLDAVWNHSDGLPSKKLYQRFGILSCSCWWVDISKYETKHENWWDAPSLCQEWTPVKSRLPFA